MKAFSLKKKKDLDCELLSAGSVLSFVSLKHLTQQGWRDALPGLETGINCPHHDCSFFGSAEVEKCCFLVIDLCTQRMRNFAWSLQLCALTVLSVYFNGEWFREWKSILIHGQQGEIVWFCEKHAEVINMITSVHAHHSESWLPNPSPGVRIASHAILLLFPQEQYLCVTTLVSAWIWSFSKSSIAGYV